MASGSFASVNLFCHHFLIGLQNKTGTPHLWIWAILLLICIVPSHAQAVEGKLSPLETTASEGIVYNVRKPIVAAVKTNALLNLIAIPNAGVEISLGNRWSMAVNGHYAWWKSEPKHWFWRTYGGDIDLRRWFGNKKANSALTGHHVGIYGQMLTYDFATGGRGYLADKWSYGTGVEYGYSLPLRKRLNLEFSLGVGYLGGEYMEYLPMEEHYVWQATKNRHWFGPTKAGISVVWLLGRGTTTTGGDGAR